MSYVVMCADGMIRHEGRFETRHEAAQWAWWGHACLAEHKIFNPDITEAELAARWGTPRHHEGR